MKPITCHMDPTNEQVEIHLQVEGHLMDARLLLRLMKPITCHILLNPTNEQVEIHLQVEGHLMDARVQGE